MYCQGVMHDYILVSMPKMETLVEMGKSQGHFYTQIFIRRFLKLSGPSPSPTTGRVDIQKVKPTVS